MLIAGVILLLCITLILGVSVPFAFGAALLLLAFTGDQDYASLLISGHWRMNSLVLLAIPLFILAGGIMERGRIATPLVELAELFVGKIRGGLSAAAIVASAIFGAISGSASATLTCIGGIMLPQLQKANYPRGISAAIVANAAPIGLLIPPSALQIIYAWVTRQSVLKCFLATVIPGMILVALLCIVNFFLLRKYKDIKVQQEKIDFAPELARRSRRAVWALMMPFIILGGIYSGIFTPTEAAGLAVIYALPVGFFIYKGLNRQNFAQTIIDAATTTGVVMVMFFMVMIVSRLLVFEDIPELIKDLVFAISDNPLVLLLMINLVLIIIGMLMDDVSGVLLGAPLLLPLVVELGIDPIHFAAIIGVNLGMGNITPPTAPLLYLGGRVGKAPINEMLKPTLIMIAFAWVPTLLITTFVPEVALWLPATVLG